MEVQPEVHFDDTAIAFSYKSDRELQKANLIFSIVNHPRASKIATTLAKWSLAAGLPVRSLIRNTVFEHFCGGETIHDSAHTVQKLRDFGVCTILDYSVEGAKDEQGFDKTADEILATFETAKDNPAIPFCVFKVTGMASMELLEKIQLKLKLSAEEETAFEHVKQRVDRRFGEEAGEREENLLAAPKARQPVVHQRGAPWGRHRWRRVRFMARGLPGSRRAFFAPNLPS
jgi:proline dehydrogenase